MWMKYRFFKHGNNLDCYWVGSLHFILFWKSRGLPLNSQKVKLLAGGSTATKQRALAFPLADTLAETSFSFGFLQVFASAWMESFNPRSLSRDTVLDATNEGCFSFFPVLVPF